MKISGSRIGTSHGSPFTFLCGKSHPLLDEEALLAHLATVTVSVGVATMVPGNSSNSSSKCNHILTGGNVIPAQPRGGCAPNLDRSVCKADHMLCKFSSTVGCLQEACAGEPHSIKCKSVCLDTCFPQKNCKVDTCSCSAPRVAHQVFVPSYDTMPAKGIVYVYRQFFPDVLAFGRAPQGQI